MNWIGAARFAIGAAALLAAFPSGAADRDPAPACPAPRDGYRRLAARAYVWGYPLIRSVQLRQNMTLPEDPFRARPASIAGAPLNRLGHARELATPETRQGVAPNNDTLYSLAFIDTASGPFVFETPNFGSRYYTFQMGQADTTTAQAFGQSTHGSRLRPLFIQGPGQDLTVPAGMIGVRSAQRYLMIAGRTLVARPEDLALAHRLQDGMRLRLWSDYRAGRDVPAPVTPQEPVERRDPPADDAPAFLSMLGAVLKDWQPAPDERAFIRSLAALGLAPGRTYDSACVGAGQLAIVTQGLQDGRRAIEQRTRALGTQVNGWTVNYQGAQFGNDRLLRAAVAMDQIYVLPAAEAMYMNAKYDSQGRPLDGTKTYALRFTGDQLPPVRFFWSATMYFAKGFLVPNEIRRYSIGDRTPRLIHTADGGIEILLQHGRPAAPADANWLPTPAGPFTVMLRLYGPGPAVRARRWAPPAIVEIAAN